MAERRFSALAGIKRRTEGREGEIASEVEVDPPATSREQPPPLPQMPAYRTMGRPPGKRSDPGWRPRTILMRTTTHRKVSGALLDQAKGPDLSELIDRLLTEWLERQ